MINKKNYLPGFLCLVVLGLILGIYSRVNYGNFKDKIAPEERIISFVTPHHLLAGDMIDDIFLKVSQSEKSNNIDRIILLSPDHFEDVSGWGFLTDERSFKTNKNVLGFDYEGASLLNENTFLRFKKDKFSSEHGINNLLPYVAEYFPGKKVLPIIIKAGAPSTKIDELVDFINSEIKGNNLVVLSSDFSHYLEENISEFHDRKAINVMSRMSFEEVYNLETDFVSGLYLAMRYSENQGANTFNLIDNSNSSEIYRKNFIGENTSYVTGYFYEGDQNKKIENNLVSFLFLGDLMLDRYVRTVIEKEGVDYLTKKIDRLFWGQDLNVLNLEGTITENQSISLGSKEGSAENLKFTFDKKETADFLKNNRIGLVNIGNNHIGDFGAEGSLETKKFLEENDIDYVGDLRNDRNFFLKKFRDKKIAIVSYNEFEYQSENKTLDLIRELKKSNDLIFVYAHWGIEYALKESEKQKALAYSFIDNGADLVIGSHPHVIQPIEVYKNKAIFYSLGNFIFDQYFSEDTMYSLGLQVAVDDDRFSFNLIPLKINRDSSSELASQEERNKLLKRAVKDKNFDQELKNEIEQGFFSIERRNN